MTDKQVDICVGLIERYVPTLVGIVLYGTAIAIVAFFWALFFYPTTVLSWLVELVL